MDTKALLCLSTILLLASVSAVPGPWSDDDNNNEHNNRRSNNRDYNGGMDGYNENRRTEIGTDGIDPRSDGIDVGDFGPVYGKNNRKMSSLLNVWISEAEDWEQWGSRRGGKGSKYGKNRKYNEDRDYKNDGHEGDGYKDDGYKKDGYERDGYKDDGYKNDGYKKDGYERDGYKDDGYKKDGYKKDGYERDGYKDDGYKNDDYKKDGYESDGYKDDGYKNDGYKKDGYEGDGYKKDGYKKDGYKKDGYKNDGYKKDGYGGGQRRKRSYKKFSFPVKQVKNYRQFPFGRFPPLISIAPWLPIFYDKLTYQTFIFSIQGGLYIIPPVINFYGQRFAVAQLIKWGYASLVSSGAPPPPAINVAPLVETVPVSGVVAGGAVAGGAVAGGGKPPPHGKTTPPPPKYNSKTYKYDGPVKTDLPAFRPRPDYLQGQYNKNGPPANSPKYSR